VAGRPHMLISNRSVEILRRRAPWRSLRPASPCPSHGVLKTRTVTASPFHHQQVPSELCVDHGVTSATSQTMQTSSPSLFPIMRRVRLPATRPKKIGSTSAGEPWQLRHIMAGRPTWGTTVLQTVTAPGDSEGTFGFAVLGRPTFIPSTHL
jgi:hypothetical protein